jgi:hypothetical protein
MKREIVYCVTRKTTGYFWYGRVYTNGWGEFIFPCLLKGPVIVLMYVYIRLLGPNFKPKYRK